MLAKDLDPLGKTYLKEHKLTSNVSVVQSCKFAYCISNHYGNLLSIDQFEMMNTILNEEETHLHILIKSRYKHIDTVSQ